MGRAARRLVRCRAVGRGALFGGEGEGEPASRGLGLDELSSTVHLTVCCTLHPLPAGLPQLYFYMLAQRKKVLSGSSGSKAAAGGTKKRQ